MVHGVRLRDGRAEWYRSRFVRDDEVVAAKGWPPVAGSAPGRRHRRRHRQHQRDRPRRHASSRSSRRAISRSSSTHELETRRAARTSTARCPAASAPTRSAIPTTGELYAAVYSPLCGRASRYVVVGADGRVRKTVDVPVPGKPMVHDCAITREATSCCSTCRSCPRRRRRRGRARFPYAWNPEYGARVGLLPREGERRGRRSGARSSPATSSIR